MVAKRDDGNTRNGTWSIEGTTLALDNSRGRILELTDSSFVLDQNGRQWHATRVTQEELEAARTKLERTTKLLVGRWSYNGHHQYTFNSDGTAIDDGEEASGKWSVDGDVLTSASGRQYKIVELGETRFLLQSIGYGGEWRGTRDSPEAREAIRAENNRLRALFVGSWRSNFGQFTLNADGTMAGGEQIASGSWSVDQGAFTSGSGREYRILELDQSRFLMTDGVGGDWRGTRDSAEAREALRAESEMNARLIVGTWKDENSTVTYNADGTSIALFDNGSTRNGKWSVEGNILTDAGNAARIVEIGDSKYVTEDLDGNRQRWHATRTK